MQFSKAALLVVVILGCALVSISTFYTGSIVSTEQPNQLIIPKNSIITSKKTGLKYYEQKAFTGQTVEYYPQQGADKAPQMKSKVSYVNGIKYGDSTYWYADGSVGFLASYLEGKLHGPNVSYWNNGNLRAVAVYENGKVQGTARQWYVSGEMFKQMHYVDGLEVGLQQAWRKNGKLYVNYENINGRIYGLKKANLCFGIDNEELIL